MPVAKAPVVEAAEGGGGATLQPEAAAAAAAAGVTQGDADVADAAANADRARGCALAAEGPGGMPPWPQLLAAGACEAVGAAAPPGWLTSPVLC